MITQTPMRIILRIMVFLTPILSGCALAVLQDPSSEIATRSPASSTTSTSFKPVDPARLYGLNKAELVAQLGEADFLRRGDGADILQYRLKSCVVDFVFTPTDNEQRLTSWHARHRIYGQDFDEKTCRRDLARRENS